MSDAVTELKPPPIKTPPTFLNAETDTRLEEEIKSLEKSLGIKTKEDRLSEASLFIDKRFLDAAVITGNTNNPERMFGNKAWADYLEARKFAKDWGNQSLNIDFILELQKRLTRRSNPKYSGRIRWGVAIGGDFNDPTKPVTYTEEQVKTIEENPLLAFRKEPPTEENTTRGYIVYPLAPEDFLKELCDWYNEERKKENYNPFSLAAQLQQKFISIHPFCDGNGTTSRLLMNWSLENDGELASVLDNPNEDILTNEETWVGNVRKGSNDYKEIKKRQYQMKEAGIEDLPALLGLQYEQAFYNYIFRYIGNAPLLSLPNGEVDHKAYEQFIKGLLKEMSLFDGFMKTTSKVRTSDRDYSISQGGLITSEYIKLHGTSLPNLAERVKEYFSGVEVYRGGMCDDSLGDTRICDLFLDYTGIGTGYRALQKSFISPHSTHQVRPEQISEVMDYYNKMVAALYFIKTHSDLENPYNDQLIGTLETTIQNHVVGGDSIWESPFVSTSLSRATSEGWAKKFSASHAKNAKHGILFKAHPPKEGTVLSFGTAKGEHLSDIAGIDTPLSFPNEREALIVGGLHPESIVEVEIFDRNGLRRIPDVIARRVKTDEGVKIEIEDRRGEFVVKRVYFYNTQVRHFELVSEEATTIAVRDLTPAYQPIDKGVFAEFVKNFISNKFKYSNLKTIKQITLTGFIYSKEENKIKSDLFKFITNKNFE